MSSKPKLSWLNFLVDFKVQSTCCEKIRLGSGFYKIFEVKKWLNMNSKPDKECERSGDIIYLSEIITNSIYWQDTPFGLAHLPNIYLSVMYQLSRLLNHTKFDSDWYDIATFPNVERINKSPVEIMLNYCQFPSIKD